MFTLKVKWNFVKSLFVLFFCFLLTLTWFSSFAQQTDCLTLQKILNLLEKKVDQKEIIKQVVKYGVNFELDTKIIIQFVKSGADESLIESIKNHRCGDLIISVPMPDSDCTQNVKVAGRSKTYKGKFVWVFSHRKDLKDQWWPQVGAVNLEPDGTWTTSARLGEVQDIGFDFEITAIWIDSTTSRNLEDYLKNCAQTGNWPPMNLPNGSPSAKITVRRAY